MTEPLVDVTGARRRRARARLRRRLVVAGIVAGVLAVIGGVAWVVLGSPWLAVREVRVEGATLVPVDQVVAAQFPRIGEGVHLLSPLLLHRGDDDRHDLAHA